MSLDVTFDPQRWWWTSLVQSTSCIGYMCGAAIASLYFWHVVSSIANKLSNILGYTCPKCPTVVLTALRSLCSINGQIIPHSYLLQMSQGTVASEARSDHAVRLLKNAGLDAADDSNFRPITNLSTMSKLLERLALARLQSHLLRSPNYCTL